MRTTMRTLLLLLPLLCAGEAQQPAAVVREYYIAAVEIGWDYIHLDEVSPATDQSPRSKEVPQKYIKAVYREYTDSTYTVPKPRPPWSGIQGPVILAQGTDRVVVHFKNLASQPYSISPVGITYWKQSEGAGYDDSTAGHEKEDDAVSPGGYYEYVWDIRAEDGPTADDPECLTYSYSSQVDTVRDINSGLIGALLICKSSAFDEGGRRNTAFVLLFAVFDETKSWYGEVGERRMRERFQRSKGRKEYHTINGYVNSTLPGLTMCQDRRNVIWHLIGIGTAPGIHSIQFQDHSLEVLNHRKATMEVTPVTFITAEMKPSTLGQFLISCQIHAHRYDGMKASFTVESCPELPGKRKIKQDDYDYLSEDYDNGESLFNTISIENKRPQVQARSSRGQGFKIWEHYIAAEEVNWDYIPHLKPTDSVLQSGYLPAAPHHLGYKYKKVAYVEYTDRSFTERKNPDKTLMGPLLKGKVKDHLHITFKNLASRPFNIYPNGLTKIHPLYKPTNEKDLRSMAVPPNGTFGYVWMLTTDDGPLDGDPQCLTQLYQSTVSPERDLASGLVGTLLICKPTALDFRGNLLGPDQQWSLIFAVFDENRSWYVDENIHKSGLTSSNTTEAEFYDSNVIYSVNGIMFSGRQFVMRQSAITFWHVANVGTQSDFLSVYFRGNLFKYEGLHQSVLTLFPMTGVSLSMEMELTGEWEISAFDSSLRSRGMSIEYTVRPSSHGDRPLVDHDEDPDDIFDFVDELELGPRGVRPQDEKEKETKPEGAGGGRRRRQAEESWTDGEVSSGAADNGETTLEIGGEATENKTDTGVEINVELESEKNGTKEESNEILLEGNQQLNTELSNLQEMDQNFLPQNLIQSDPEQQTVDLLGLEYNYTTNINTSGIDLSLEYDDYNQEVNGTSDAFATNYIDPRSGGTRYHHYYIAAEEISWDYGIRKPHQLIKPRETRRGMRKFLSEYKKVVFRAYTDKDFLQPVGRGELQEHLGIMGPLIRADVNKLLIVVFKNKASRPYSFHLHGVYDRSQGAGIIQTHDTSAPPGVPGEPVAPGEARTYIWKVTGQQGPTEAEFDCKAGAYYSTVDKERDLHSGLIGPLVICKNTTVHAQPAVKEFALLFHTFDETKSWYLEENLQKHCAPPCQADPEDPWYQISNKFAGVNGYVAETLPGLLVAQYQRVRWHLLNVGSDGEYHAVHFHGLPFTVHTEQKHRMGVYSLFPGVFGTVEMSPRTVGTWLVECTIGDYQLAGMRAKLLVYDPECVFPLGMKSGRIDDSQITASDYIDNWEPRLARLDQSGYINAWMGKNKMSWIQVDLKRPTLLHGVQTQGVRSNLRDHYIFQFSISYSLDQETWTTYRGRRPMQRKEFRSYMDGSKVKDNIFSVPFVGRYIRIQPISFVQRPALRLELLGCDLNSCSNPLGLQTRAIPDSSFTASSYYSSLLRSWGPSLARLHQEGSTNAWRPKYNNPHEWLEVDLKTVKRITGVVTQGARSFLTQMMVTEFSVTVSQDKHTWSSVLDEDSQREKILTGNDDPDEEALSVFDPPLFGRYLRIHPRGWVNDIALRLEVLGCDTQQAP